MKKNTQQNVQETIIPKKQTKSVAFLEKYPAICAKLINFVLFCVIYLSFTAAFQTNDDVGMMLEAAGVAIAAEPTEYLLFSNILIGILLKNLYQISTSVAWYGWYLVGSLFLAHWAILYVILKRNPNFTAIFLYAIYLFVAASFALQSLQFTTVSALTAVGGLALLVFNTEDLEFNFKKIFSLPNICGIALIVWSSLIRLPSLALMTFLLAPVLAVAFWEQKLEIFKRLIPLMIAFLICAIPFLINKSYYSQGNWERAMQENEIIGKFVDDQLMQKAPQEAQQKAMQAAGWSPTDFSMMVFWFFQDKQTYGLEKVTAAKNELQQYDKKTTFDDILKNQKEDVFGNEFVNRCLMVCVFLSIFLLQKRNYVSIGATAILVPVVIAFLFYYLRVRFYVIYPMFIYLALLPLLLIRKNQALTLDFQEFGARKILALVALAVVFFSSFSVLKKINENSKQTQDLNKNLKTMVSGLNPQAKNLYVSWANSFPFEWAAPFENINYLKDLHLFLLGSIQRTPIADQNLQKNGINNLYQAIAEKENVFLLIRQDYLQQWLGLLNNYMQEHYKKAINAKSVLKTGNMVVVDVSYAN